MKKIKICIFFLCIIINFKAYATDAEFNEWKKKFKSIALERGVSLSTIENTVGKSIFLKDVIKFDRYQPEFYEDTKNYAIDYNKDKNINLKNIEDSFASAANYLKQIGWDNNKPCFYKVELINQTPHKYLNTSAKKIKHKNKISYLKKYIKNNEILNDLDNLKAALVTPDYDIIPDAKKLSPAYVVFDNYELILKWNRSLRFALAVCTLKSKFKNAI
jgi:membrane-bound lytic murein transglycosylase B